MVPKIYAIAKDICCTRRLVYFMKTHTLKNSVERQRDPIKEETLI